MSYQKRTSRRPFRRFTVLSARTLAASLATQENPEKGLCPYEPVPLSEEPEIELFRDESKKFHRNSKPSGASKSTSPRGITDPVSSNHGGECLSQKPKVELQNGNLVKTGSQDGSGEGNAKEKCTSQKALKEKDPKSFTQNLFDTEAMKFLQLAKVRENLLYWAPWLQKEVNNISRDSQGLVGAGGRNTDTGTKKNDQYNSLHSEMRETFTSVQKQTEEPTALTSSINKYPGPRGDAYVGCQSSHKSQTAPPGTLASNSMASDALSISQTPDDCILQDGPSDDNDVDDIESYDYKLSLAFRETQTFTSTDTGKLEKWIACNDPTGAASKATETISNNPATVPADPDPDTVELPQALGRFTLENISALVDTVKGVTPGHGDGYGFLQSLGRATTISPLSRCVRDTATQQEMNIVFGTQSIVYVLSTINALLRSFVGSVDVVSSEYKQSTKSAEMIKAFRLLMEIDHHPRNIFPSLWISIGKLHPPFSVRSRGALLKARRSAKSDCPLVDSTSESQSVHADFLGNIDAAHVIKIALAALVASIPECNLDTWASVRRLRASGRIAPAFNGLHGETVLMDSLLKVMDSFDDELALSLMMRVVRVVAARQCLFEISGFQGPSTEDSIPMKNGEDFMDVLLREVIDSDIIDTISSQSSSASMSDGSMATAKFKRNEMGIQIPVTSQNSVLSVLVEWLRGVIFSEWDGKAEISRWGAVGGALEFMLHLCKLSLI